MSTTPATFTTAANETIQGALARPDGASKGAVVVIHEWFGLNDDIKGICERFASEGIAALGVDLYGGRLAADDAEALKLVNEMKTSDAIEIVRAAAEHLRSIGFEKIGVTGFCLGGAMSLASGCNVEGLAAVVPFYGTPRDEFLDFSRVKAPILGHYGKNDPIIPVARVESIEKKAKETGAEITLYFYDAGHAFMRRGDPAAFVEAASKLAWERTIAFLRANLA